MWAMERIYMKIRWRIGNFLHILYIALAAFGLGSMSFKGSRLSTILTVSTLTRTTLFTKSTIYRGSSDHCQSFASFRIWESLSIVTAYRSMTQSIADFPFTT